MYTELSKIIEAGLAKDTSRVISYATLLADKFEKEGDNRLATKIRKVLERSSTSKPTIKEQFFNLPVDNETRLNIANIIDTEDSSFDLTLSASVQTAINEFTEIISHKEKLLVAGIELNTSLLLYGPPGCGKTSLAYYIAHILGLPIMVARLDSMISSLLGNTSKNLRKLFEYANSKPCVLFLDEFDAIAKNRKDQNEQGELKRVINSLLQNIDDYLAAGNILIAATNHEELLDDAIWRRFEKVISVDKPNLLDIKILINKLLTKKTNDINEVELDRIAKLLLGQSYSEIKKIINNAITKSIIKDKDTLRYIDIIFTYFQYSHSNDYMEDIAIQFMLDNSITQREVSEFFNISTRQVRKNITSK